MRKPARLDMTRTPMRICPVEKEETEEEDDDAEDEDDDEDGGGCRWPRRETVGQAGGEVRGHEVGVEVGVGRKR